MKALFYTKTLIAIAVAIAAAAAADSQAQEQPIPPPATESALPANIIPGSPLAEVIKMLQAGVDLSTIQSYVQNSPNPFNLDADKILFLKDEGAPNDLINAMMDRDKALAATPVTVSSAPVAPPTTVTTETPTTEDTTPPPADVNVDYFNAELTPYGAWVTVDGYGRCWRPTVAYYDSTWTPYCDRGHWVYTDHGWYWDSDYAWGMTFHYGRWFHHAHHGWCWYPDTVWAPSWVTWRSGGAYCGWAPLPPFAVYRPGAGFFYRGVSVGVNFDFGLDAGLFVFLGSDHFCDRRPHDFMIGRDRHLEVFRQTSPINRFEIHDHDRFMVNHGFGPEHIATAMHHPIEPVHINSLPGAGHQGWRGEGFHHTMQIHPDGGNSFPNRNPGHATYDPRSPSHDVNHGPNPNHGVTPPVVGNHDLNHPDTGHDANHGPNPSHGVTPPVIGNHDLNHPDTGHDANHGPNPSHGVTPPVVGNHDLNHPDTGHDANHGPSPSHNLNPIIVNRDTSHGYLTEGSRGNGQANPGTPQAPVNTFNGGHGDAPVAHSTPQNPPGSGYHYVTPSTANTGPQTHSPSQNPAPGHTEFSHPSAPVSQFGGNRPSPGQPTSPSQPAQYHAPGNMDHGATQLQPHQTYTPPPPSYSQPSSPAPSSPAPARSSGGGNAPTHSSGSGNNNNNSGGNNNNGGNNNSNGNNNNSNGGGHH